jgi:preprotein translocase subunit SecD
VAKKTIRPGRTLLIFAAVTAVMYGLVALGGTWKPHLGLDLEGGTRITLVAEGHPTKDSLNQAATIINQRVNGNGITEASVTTQGGTNIIVEIPGKTRQDLVDSVKRTAQMRFRIEAYCTQLTQSFCQASGLPQSAQASSSASPSGSALPSPSSSPSASDSSSPAAKKAKKGDKVKGSAQRPAPAFALRAADGKTPSDKATKPAKKKSADKPGASSSPVANPSQAAQQAAQQTAADDKGAAVDDYLKWSKDPGSAWQLLWAVSQCDPGSHIALVPAIANTMSVTDPLSSKTLQARLKNVKKADLVRAVDDPERPLISCDDSGNKYLLSTAVIEGTQLKSASAGQDTQQSLGQWIVQLTFKGDAKSTFADLSRKMYSGSGTQYEGGRFAIVLDGQTLSDPGFDGVIPNGQAQISGNFTQDSAQSLATSLKFGALPVKFKNDVSDENIGPSLAGDQLSAGILAGVIGLAIVMIYCLLYYRGLGLVVIASLVIAGIVTYAAVLLLATAAGFTLTLPGIAGLIVAVGITADSFIVYFERIRDEMRAGKSMRVAVQAGWIRARNTCLAADAVSFLAALVLYIFAIGDVRGFAFALGLSTLIDVAVFFWFTHPMLTLLSKRAFFNTGSRFSGLSPETLGIDGEIRPSVTVGGRA